jgi:uncharacterized protein (DUF2141 family)
MFKKMAKGAFFLAIAAFAVPAGAQVLGPDAAACRAGGDRPAFLVTVHGFKAHTGRIRVQLYRANDEFLARGRYLQRIDEAVSSSGAMRFCLTAPAPGRYAIAVRHDVDGSGSSGWNDGAGFSRNPDISLTHLRPRPAEVAIPVGRAVVPVSVVLNYRFGLSIHPVRG